MKNLYMPIKAIVTQIEEHSKDVKLFRFKREKGVFPKNREGLIFIPGQFVMAGLWGYGEAPFGLLSSPFENRFGEVLVKRTGIVTSALHRLKVGEELTVRGPYGNGFPIDFFEEKDIVLVSGGCGIPPVAALVEYIIKNRKRFGRIYLLYGAAAPQDILVKDKLNKWSKHINVLLTVDRPAKGWKGYVGMGSEIVKEIEVDPMDAAAAMCGPVPMTEAFQKKFIELGVAASRIHFEEFNFR